MTRRVRPRYRAEAALTYLSAKKSWSLKNLHHPRNSVQAVRVRSRVLRKLTLLRAHHMLKRTKPSKKLRRKKLSKKPRKIA